MPALAKSLNTMTLESPGLFKKPAPPALGKLGRSRSMGVAEDAMSSSNTAHHHHSLPMAASRSCDAILQPHAHAHAAQTSLLPRVSGREVDVVYIDVDTVIVVCVRCVWVCSARMLLVLLPATPCLFVL